MFGLGCPPYATVFLFFHALNYLEIWKTSIPEFLKRLHLVLAGAVQRAGPYSMSIRCLCL